MSKQEVRNQPYRRPMIPLPMKITEQHREALVAMRDETGVPITELVRRALDEFIARNSKETR